MEPERAIDPESMVIVGFRDGLRFVIDHLLNICRYFDPNRRLLLAIAGGSCSGKSVFAVRLRNILEAMGVGVSKLALDDYYKDGDDATLPVDGGGRNIFDLPESFHLDHFRDNIAILLDGRSVASPIFDKKTNRRAKLIRRVESEQVIIVEGLFAVSVLSGDFTKDLAKNILTVFIDANENVRTARRIRRDTGALHDNMEDTAKFIRERVEPYYRRHIAFQKDLADIVVTNNDDDLVSCPQPTGG